MTKSPTLVIYWADTRKVLSRKERKELEFNGELIAVNQNEVSLIDRVSDRKVIIRGVNDVRSPKLWEFIN